MLIGSSSAIQLGNQALAAVRTLHSTGADAVSGWARHLHAAVVVFGAAGLTAAVRQLRDCGDRLADEERLRREVTAYLTIELSLQRLSQQEFGRLVCRTIATRSSFARAALLLPEDSGQLAVAGSAGVDDLTTQALNRWGAEVSGNPALLDSLERVGASSFCLRLERRGRQTEPHTLNCSTVHLIPLRSASGLLGALAVCSTPRPSVAGTLSRQRLHCFLEPLEALALSLTFQLSQLTREKPRRRPHLIRPLAEAGPTATPHPSRRRRSDHLDSPTLGSASQISLQQLVAIAASATDLPSSNSTGAMVGFPAIDYNRALPALVQIHRRSSGAPAALAVVPSPVLQPALTLPLDSAAFAPHSSVARR